MGQSEKCERNFTVMSSGWWPLMTTHGKCKSRAGDGMPCGQLNGSRAACVRKQGNVTWHHHHQKEKQAKKPGTHPPTPHPCPQTPHPSLDSHQLHPVASHSSPVVSGLAASSWRETQQFLRGSPVPYWEGASGVVAGPMWCSQAGNRY